MKRLVADSGPLLHLHEAGGLHLFPLIGEITAPPGVLAEVRAHAPSLWPTALPAWLKPIPLSLAAAQRAASWRQAGILHLGEAEALALAQENLPDWFITDDAAARLVAESLGIETHGSLGIVLWSAAKNLVEQAEAESLLTGLEQSSLWMSPLVRARARAALKNIFPAD